MEIKFQKTLNFLEIKKEVTTLHPPESHDMINEEKKITHVRRHIELTAA
jgi:hypothetical protein